MSGLILKGEYQNVGEFYFKIEGVSGWQFVENFDIKNSKPTGITIVFYEGHQVKVKDDNRILCNFLAKHFKSKIPVGLKEFNNDLHKSKGNLNERGE